MPSSPLFFFLSSASNQSLAPHLAPLVCTRVEVHLWTDADTMWMRSRGVCLVGHEGEVYGMVWGRVQPYRKLPRKWKPGCGAPGLSLFPAQVTEGRWCRRGALLF